MDIYLIQWTYLILTQNFHRNVSITFNGPPRTTASSKGLVLFKFNIRFTQYIEHDIYLTIKENISLSLASSSLASFGAPIT